MVCYSFIYSVHCTTGDVQLVGDSRYNNFGRVEVCIDGDWWKVCNDAFTNLDASVLCKQLGFSPYGENQSNVILWLELMLHLLGAIARSSVYQEPALDYFVSQLNCSGSEEDIFACNHSRSQSGLACTSDAGLICQSKVS